MGELNDLLGIEYPILQAPMNWATSVELVAAVSNAGGLGILGPNSGLRGPLRDPEAMGEHLRAEIRRIRELTERPFGVNVPIGRGMGRAFSDSATRTAIEERVPIVVTATGSPDVYTGALKDADIVVLHAVSSVHHATKAAAAGVDAVVVEGFEAGGHIGVNELPLLALLPQVRQAIRLPIIAAGGMVDGRGLAVARLLGAGAIYMGTRFIATQESPVHPAVKAAILAAGDSATIAWGRRLELARSLRNHFTEEYLRLESTGASSEDLRRFVAAYDRFGGVGRRAGAMVYGDVDEGEVYLGSGVGLIDAILPAGEVVRRVWQDARGLCSSQTG